VRCSGSRAEPIGIDAVRDASGGAAPTPSPASSRRSRR
jgi:hypothetical protein